MKIASNPRLTAALSHLTVYVIAFAGSEDRRTIMTERLSRLGLKPTFIDAVDGRSLSEADCQRYLDRKRQAYLPRQLSSGALGCSLSHIAAWNALRASQDAYALILEDDARFFDDTCAVLSDILSRGAEFDIISLHHRKQRPHHKIADLTDGHSISMLRYAHIGATAYLISRHSAARLLEGALPIRFEVDLYMNRWWEHGVSNLFIHPPLAEEDGRCSTIGYQKKLPVWAGDTSLMRIERRFRRMLDSSQKRLGFVSYLQNCRNQWSPHKR